LLTAQKQGKEVSGREEGKRREGEIEDHRDASRIGTENGGEQPSN